MVLLHKQLIINSNIFFAMEKKIYEQPLIEVLEIEVEKGFAQSGTPGGSEGMAPGGAWDDWN